MLISQKYVVDPNAETRYCGAKAGQDSNSTDDNSAPRPRDKSSFV